MSSIPQPNVRSIGRFRIIAICFWAAAVLAALGYYVYDPARFAPERIAASIREFETAALCIYFAISVVRGLSFLPSTPLVIAGTLIFPHHPWIVLAVSLIGIAASSVMIYWLSDALGIAEYFEGRKPRHVALIRDRLERPAGLLFVLLWSFFPLVPTDAVCYVAGSIRMSFAKFLIALLLGELVLCCFYIFSGGYLMQLLTR